jgi:tetratricopeptide (TPR) repeat protein
MFRKKIVLAMALSILGCGTCLQAQPPSWTIDLLGKEKKPEKFENKKLGSEKTESKKFTFFRRFVQNNVTRYNFYFNAANKLDAVLERAKVSQQDDYTKLLSFYPYTLENTASQTGDLDSVILKCTAGILLHDLRNDWVDNLYLLIGKAYLLRKDFDSASMTFQFINYNLFPRKKGEDDSRVVGTGSSAMGSAISIANPEKRNLLQKTFGKAPSRNESLIWMARTLTEQEEYGEAAGLINTLQNDPNLPKRLYPDLEEVAAYWFYRQGMYDSSAVHLEKALSNAENRDDRARWEFLLAQLLERSGQFDKASDYYGRAGKRTNNPIMDIHARLNDAKMLKQGGNLKELENSLNNLLSMGRKDKFESYRDIIYYSAGQMAMQKPDTAAAVGYFYRSLQYNTANVPYKNKAFLQLGDIAYERKQYRQAFAWYDSLQSGDTTIGAERLAQLQARRNALSKIVEKIDVIDREDSLQHIAALPPAERDALLKKMVKQLRKQRGLKEEDNAGDSGPITFNNDRNNSKPVDLFEGNSKGTWYFYNSSLKSKGFSEFRRNWGDRPNVDNWWRKAALQAGAPSPAPGLNDPNADGGKAGQGKTDATAGGDISFDGLQANLPLTPEKLAASHQLLSTNVYELGKLYQQELEDYEEAIATYEESLERYPDSLYEGEIYLNLHFCHQKLGNTAKANYYKNLLTSGKWAGSKAAKLLTNPGAVSSNAKIPEATKAYEAIYTMFIEGNFTEALEQKKKLDAQYGKNYWTPQLLYIEAVYHIKQRHDSVATAVLNDIVSLYPKSPLKPKAQNMIDVLKRRKEIEDYLTALQVTRVAEDAPMKVTDDPVKPAPKPPVAQPPVTPPPPPTTQPTQQPTQPPVVPPPVLAPPPAKDTVKKAPPALVYNSFRMTLDQPHYVVMLLDKVDPVYIREARTALLRYHRDIGNGLPIEINKDLLDVNQEMLVYVQFNNAEEALQYYEKVKKAAPVEISWLPPAKYSFFIITEPNLQLLKTNKDLTGYKKLLNMQYPGKF